MVIPFSGNVNWYQRETFIFCWRKNQRCDLFHIDFFSRSLIFVHSQGDLLGHKFGVITFQESRASNCLTLNKIVLSMYDNYRDMKEKTLSVHNTASLQVTFLKSPKDRDLICYSRFRIDSTRISEKLEAATKGWRKVKPLKVRNKTHKIPKFYANMFKYHFM